LWAFERMKRTKNKAEVLRLIRDYNLPREAVPTEWLNDVDVWAALLERMPMTALIRNLAKMTAVGLLEPLSDATKAVVAQLADAERLRRSRVHPLAVLNALRVYQQGHGDKGSLTWTPVAKVVDALDDAFYAAFGNVEPTGKRVMIALDVSASMSAPIAGTGLSCCEASSALALVTARVEADCGVYRFNTGLEPVDISPRMRLDGVLKQTRSINGGGTDCSLPMVYAAQHKIPVDAFCVYTDSETWAGKVHPQEALRAFRDKLAKPDAAEVVVGMEATEFTIADPKDPRTLDVVGFDLQTPAAIAEFVRG
ncbi:MAG TPA: TROVE domain-containing protein, partial [Burkholderiaceae bacterium]|nr:TROVE domain-containing protein [Burkholderiaceae bacterium]